MLSHFPFSMQRDFDRPFKPYSNPTTSTSLPVPSYFGAPPMSMPHYMQPHTGQMTSHSASSNNLMGMHLPNTQSGLKHPTTSIPKPPSEHLTDISDSTPNRHPSTESIDSNDNQKDNVKLESQNSVSSESPPPNDNEEDDDGFKMPPKKRQLVAPTDSKDTEYWDKRRKNNESAKRSRDARRMKEEAIAMRVVYLEQENLQLRTEKTMLRSKIEEYRCMLGMPSFPVK